MSSSVSNVKLYLEKLGITTQGAGTDGISRPPLVPSVSPVSGFTGRGLRLRLKTNKYVSALS